MLNINYTHYMILKFRLQDYVDERQNYWLDRPTVNSGSAWGKPGLQTLVQNGNPSCSKTKTLPLFGSISRIIRLPHISMKIHPIVPGKFGMHVCVYLDRQCQIWGLGSKVWIDHLHISHNASWLEANIRALKPIVQLCSPESKSTHILDSNLGAIGDVCNWLTPIEWIIENTCFLIFILIHINLKSKLWKKMVIDTVIRLKHRTLRLPAILSLHTEWLNTVPTLASHTGLLPGRLFSSGEMAGGGSKISSVLNYRLALEIPLDLYCVVFTNIIEHTRE